ncbi:hypothetical protein [Enterococcus ratti]|uniref:Uncharacterized protein n=1 Tax=Enterococcus ratti TaxID=150033 RepID=A0A1L8WPI3_9ENTE|nr:hypothetical protein [Enterococcus ratti]OJG82929.1 hypothetical protein RV14_GL001931 [Enterococcus ratti]
MKKIFSIILVSSTLLSGAAMGGNAVFAEQASQKISAAKVSHSLEFEQIKEAISEFYYVENNQKMLNNRVMQSKIDDLLNQVNQLADPLEKQLLTKELKEIESRVYEMRLATEDGEVIAQVSVIVNDNSLDVYTRTFRNTLWKNPNQAYGKISIKEKNGSRTRAIFNKTYEVGNYVTSVKKLKRTGKDATIVISADRAALQVNKTIKLPNTTTGTYEFKINDQEKSVYLNSFIPNA